MGTTIKHIALAMKCFMNILGVTLRSPKSTHSCQSVENPTVAIVNNPTHLQLTTAPMLKPLRNSHNHQPSVKGLNRFSLQKPTQKNVVKAVKNKRGESKRISLDCVMSPLSNVTNRAPIRAEVARQSRARRVRYVNGTVATPSKAGSIRMATYGTLS